MVLEINAVNTAIVGVALILSLGILAAIGVWSEKYFERHPLKDEKPE